MRSSKEGQQLKSFGIIYVQQAELHLKPVRPCWVGMHRQLRKHIGSNMTCSTDPLHTFHSVCDCDA